MSTTTKNQTKPEALTVRTDLNAGLRERHPDAVWKPRWKEAQIALTDVYRWVETGKAPTPREIARFNLADLPNFNLEAQELAFVAQMEATEAENKPGWSSPMLESLLKKLRALRKKT